jgi:hypothetical protein
VVLLLDDGDDADDDDDDVLAFAVSLRRAIASVLRRAFSSDMLRLMASCLCASRLIACCRFSLAAATLILWRFTVCSDVTAERRGGRPGPGGGVRKALLVEGL